MKTTKLYTSLLLSLLFVLSTVLVKADDFTKKYNKTFKVNAESTLEIYNKYGDVHIDNWDKDEVSIHVVITVKNASENKANSTFKKIEINFSEEGNTYKAITELNDAINNTNFSIDYEVKMPSKINLNLTNKYGNIFVDQVDGHALIVSKYGNLRVNKLTRGNIKPVNQVYLGYSGGGSTIGEADWLKLVVKYSRINISNAKALMIESKYSKLDIDKARSIVAESKYDKPYRIGEVANFVVTQGGYSSYEIGTLTSKFEGDVKYSSVTIDEVAADFKLIKLQIKYGHADIDIPESASYELKAEVEYGSIDFPKTGKVNKIAGHTESSVFGTVGSSKNPNAKVIIVSKYGNIDLD